MDMQMTEFYIIIKSMPNFNLRFPTTKAKTQDNRWFALFTRKRQTDFSGWSKAFPETGLNKFSHLDSEWCNVSSTSSQKGNRRPHSAVYWFLKISIGKW